jgi:hypothetical protein
VALVTYTTADGGAERILAYGGSDASPPGTPEPALTIDRSGGPRAGARRFENACGRYAGPPLPHLVAACTAPDGSHWALQSWQRIQPLRGVEAFRPGHMAFELRLSHWSGPLAELEVFPNWTHGGSLQGLFGRLTYRGLPVHGSRTPSATRHDPKSRYVYIDTLDSPYGAGWKREAAKVTHVGSGGFCYSFAPIPAPRGYPTPMPTVPGVGERHRVTVVGPGLTPDLQWEGAALGPFDPDADARMDALFDEILGADRVCAGER